jgi:hypothetical protein
MSIDPRDIPLVQTLTLQDMDSGESFRAEVSWTEGKVSVVRLDGGDVPDISSLCYQTDRMVTVDGEEKLAQPVRLRLAPENTRSHFGFTEGEVEEDIYPPSSGGTYERLFGSDFIVSTMLQRELDSMRFWLLVLTQEEGRVVHHRPVFDYEVFFHRFKNQYFSINQFPLNIWARKRRQESREALGELPTPSWEALYRFSEGYDFKDFKMGRNMRETVDQLVPRDMPDFYRESFILGLCAIFSPDLMNTDPLDLEDTVEDMVIARVILMTHYDNLLRGSTTSDLLRVINSPKSPSHLTHDAIVQYSWFLPRTELEARLFTRQTESVLIQHCRKLTEEQSTRPKFPVTWEEAKRSTEKWKDRAILVGYIPTMTGRFNPSRLGLRSLMYLGGAYRWPHKHSTWNASAVWGERNLQIQEMLLPPHAVERVTRFLERVLVTRWYSRRVNYDSYDQERGEWTYDSVKMANKVEKRVSMSRLSREHQIGSDNKVTIPDRTEAMILDGLGNYLRYQDLEKHEGLWEVMGIAPDEFESRTKSLVDDGMVRLSYHFYQARYTSRCLVLQGNMGHIRSLAKSLLDSAPTCSVYLFDDSAFIIASMHPDRMIPFAETLIPRAAENDVLVESWTVNRHQNYRWGLLHRLLREDRSWDDDISGLLCQARGLKTE